MKRVGVDVGGTFTDLIWVDEASGQVVVHKVPTTPADPARGVMSGVVELCELAGSTAAAIDQFFHGTTIATNIVIEHNGAEVGMITTRGFRDILHIARHKRPFNFSLHQELPWQKYPLVRRRHRLTVSERVTAPTGEVLEPLNLEEARAAVRKLRAAGVEAVAICLLFSILNPEHEQQVKAVVQAEFPEAFISVSSEVLPQYREYERFSTTALNAYVGPKVNRYLKNLERELAANGVRGGLRLMTSGGGVATYEGATERPVNLLMSGPVAGTIGGIWVGQLAGHPSVVTLDVGGTSADIGLAYGGEVRMKHLLDTRLGDYHAMIPMVDVDTLGAGGGSIAHVDDGGIFHVGPSSAGADPGPACYGRGGTLPTVTDAMVVLGRLDPHNFLGGRMRLQPDLAVAAIRTHVCQPLGLDLIDAALGIVQIATHNMVQGIEMNSVRKGFDPREFSLVAFGGAGPLFGVECALAMSMPWVLVPPYPGITAAMGLLATDTSYEFTATVMQRLSDLDFERVQAQYDELTAQARRRLEADGFRGQDLMLHFAADCRYMGQGYELRAAVPGGTVGPAWAEQVRESFHKVHEREYGRRFPDMEVQVVNVRVVGVGRMAPLQLPRLSAGNGDPRAALQRMAQLPFAKPGGGHGMYATAFYDRTRLRAGDRFVGPAIVLAPDTTAVINPGLPAEVDVHGNILIDCRNARGGEH